ncbi:glycerol-3-phosphate 1-O-acyltransferase PlsY [Chloroflexota bacterium]
MIIAQYLAAALIGYLVGSIPFGVLIGKRSAKIDIRQIGSGKTGTTNVLRAAGKQAAALVLVLDLLKGVLAVILTRLIFGGDYPMAGDPGLWSTARIAEVLAASAAISGHNWSIFLKFKGGRGVATFIGGLAALYWPAAVFGGVVLIIVAAVSRYMSLGSITGAISAFIMLIPLTIMNKSPIEYLIYTMIGAIFIFIRHYDNISRLVSGKERRLGEKAEMKNTTSSTNSKN